MKVKRIHVVCIVLALCVCALMSWVGLRRSIVGVIQTISGKKTVADRVDQFGPIVQARLAPDFERIGVSYPPKRIILVGLKFEKQLEVWVAGEGTSFKHLRTYPIIGASGELGPKLKEGDRQVPEGLYRIESLNPNSLYHLSLRVNYPNAFDQTRGQLDGRQDLGGDIMIHGSTGSIGCLAMGDQAAEDLFILAAETGISGIRVILSPVDFRVRDLPSRMPDVPAWTDELYASIRNELARLTKGVGSARFMEK